MSYAIIRNAKYKAANLPSISRHNERQNEKYGNQDIDTSRTHENYHFVEPQSQSYEKEFDRLRDESGLKGNLRLTGKKQSNVACEFLITSDKPFFDSLGAERTKQFFADCHEFVKNKCGERNIISSVVHMDESTPHMHVTYIPVVKAKDKQGNVCEKINCSQFWKGFNSYGKLQDEFHRFCIERGHDLERGEVGSQREHLEGKEYKRDCLKHEIEKLEQQKNTLLGELRGVISSVKLVQDIEAVPVKKSLIGGNIELSEANWNKVKEMAKAAGGYGFEYGKLKAEVERLRPQVESTITLKIENGKLRNRIKGIDDALKDGDRLISEVKEALQKVSPEIRNAFMKEFDAVQRAREVVKPIKERYQGR